MAETEGGPKRVVRSSVIVGRAKPVTPRAAAPEAGVPSWTSTPTQTSASTPAPPSPEFRARTQPRFTFFALWGVILVGASVAGLIVDFTAPWEKEGSLTRDRDEFNAASQTDYEDRYTLWPLLAFIFLILVGLLLVLVDAIPNLVGAQRILQAILLAIGAFFGFLVTLASFRLLGNYFARLASSRAIIPEYQLHVAPYVNLALGLTIVLGSLWLLRKALALFLERPARGRLGNAAVKLAGWTAVVAAATLLLNPLLPLATEDVGTKSLHHGEAAIYRFGEQTFLGREENKDPGGHLGLAHGMLWLVLYLAIGAALFALLERSGRLANLWGGLTQLYGLTAIPIIIGTIFTILLYLAIPDMGGQLRGDVQLNLNWFLPLSYLALAVLYVVYLRRVGLPYFSAMRQIAQARAPAPQFNG